jgi:hypothetical protein
MENDVARDVAHSPYHGVLYIKNVTVAQCVRKYKFIYARKKRVAFPVAVFPGLKSGR